VSAIGWCPMSRPRSLRTRLALLIGVAVLVLLVVAGLVVAQIVGGQLQTSLEREVDRALDRAAAAAASGDPIDDVVMRSGGPAIQTLDQITRLPLGTADLLDGQIATLDSDGEQVLVGRRNVVLPDGSSATVIATAPLADMNATVRGIRIAAVTVPPVLAALMAAAVWLSVGRALQPVERLRSDADRIRDSNSRGRLTPPGSASELDRLAATLNDMLDRVVSSADRQREFVSNASHELRSPITTVRAALEVDRSLQPDTRAVVVPELTRLERLVDDLLSLARLTEGGEPAFTEIDLDDLVREQAALVRVPVVDTSAVTPVKVYGDRPSLEHAVRNLLYNAQRHARTRVVISLSASGGRAVLHVDDDGTGVAAHHRATIFDRFTRLDDGRARDHGGAGLGLAIVRAATDLHRGTAECDESPLGGARFTVNIPANGRGCSCASTRSTCQYG
jgi:signal transduction histidine kinase